MSKLNPLYSASNPLNIIGLMSGTSMDAIDGVCVEIYEDKKGFHYKILSTGSKPIPKNIRDRLLVCIDNKGPVLREICSLNIVLGQLFADVATMVMYEAGLKSENIHGVGSHGQTMYHLPPVAEGLIGSTLQIGDATVIAERLGVTAVGDFRVRDIAVGGQGAPLVCLADQKLFQSDDKVRCVHNIGGIANVTVLPKKSDNQEIIAFDTGPGNMLIDAAMRHFFDKPFDENGEVAAQGQVYQDLLTHLVRHEFLNEEPPKTTGREEFGEQCFKTLLTEFSDVEPKDWVATLTAFTAQSMVEAYQKFIFNEFQVDEVIIGGGGVFNTTLVTQFEKALKEYQPQIKVLTHDDFGVGNQYKEALAFAILAWATLTGQPGNIPSCTGADRPAILGKVIL